MTRPCYHDQLFQNNTINNMKKCCIAEKRGDTSFIHSKRSTKYHKCDIVVIENKMNKRYDGIVDRYR